MYSHKVGLLLRLTILALIIVSLIFHHTVVTFWSLATLNLTWPVKSEFFTLSATNDFDVTFAAYKKDALSAAPYEDLVPPIIHHIALGNDITKWKDDWDNAVNSCLDKHPGWTSYIWTEEKATRFVTEHFPEIAPTWLSYPYQVQRVDALRYMVLYEYGGVVLDMDLKCKRALGPLRRFDFVAPAAYPAGLSIGFMMARERSQFVGDLVQKLPAYNVRWLGLPYSTVMFSTGCHYASTIHTQQINRTELKVLPKPLHSLNGRVSTPLFDHLGSSSWHAYDALLMRKLRANGRLAMFVFIFLFTLAVAFSRKRRIFLPTKLNKSTSS